MASESSDFSAFYDLTLIWIPFSEDEPTSVANTAQNKLFLPEEPLAEESLQPEAAATLRRTMRAHRENQDFESPEAAIQALHDYTAPRGYGLTILRSKRGENGVKRRYIFDATVVYHIYPGRPEGSSTQRDNP